MAKAVTITIVTIPHKTQRYNTVGDWQFNEKGDLFITISDMGDWKKEFLVAFHELIEVMLCKHRGISQELVDKFDIDYEAKRDSEDVESEPGDAPGAPYRKEHFLATSLERIMSQELDVDWRAYEEAIFNL